MPGAVKRLEDIQLDPARLRATEDAIKRALTIPASTVPPPTEPKRTSKKRKPTRPGR